MNMNQRAINAYTKMDVDVAAIAASPHKLVLMLFEGAIKAVAKARLAMQKKQIKAKCDAIDRAIAIIQDGLQLSLDTKKGGALAENLNALYEYMCVQLALANAQNDVAKLDEVGRMLMDFKKSWEQIDPSAQQAKPVASVTTDSKPRTPAPVADKVLEKPAVDAVPVAAQPAKSSLQPAVLAKQQAESVSAVVRQENEANIVPPTAIVTKVLKGYAMTAVPESSGRPMSLKA